MTVSIVIFYDIDCWIINNRPSLLNDCGTELQNSKVRKILEGEGTTPCVSMPFIPDQNAAAEHENHILVESTWTMPHLKILPLKLFTEDVNSLVYILILNKIGSSSIKRKSPMNYGLIKKFQALMIYVYLELNASSIYTRLTERNGVEKVSKISWLSAVEKKIAIECIYIKEHVEFLFFRIKIFPFGNTACSSEDNCEKNIEVIGKSQRQ